MKLRNTFLFTILAVVALASLAPAGTTSQVVLYPSNINSAPTCPPYTTVPPQGPNFNDPCAPVSALNSTSGNPSPKSPPASLTFTGFTAGSGGVPAGMVLLGVTLYINTYGKTDDQIVNTLVDSNGNTVANTGNLAPQITNLLSLTQDGTNATNPFFSQQLTGEQVNYGQAAIFGDYGDNNRANCPACTTPTKGGLGYNLLPGGDAPGNTDETFDIRQWENQLVWNDTNTGLLGYGGGYHATFTSASNSPDRVPVENLVGSGTTAAPGNTGSVGSLGGTLGCDITGICNLTGLVGGSDFTIYYQGAGGTTGTTGSGESPTLLVGTGVGLKLVYTYGYPTIPEPGTLLLLGSGLSMAASFIRRKVTRK